MIPLRNQVALILLQIENVDGLHNKATSAPVTSNNSTPQQKPISLNSQADMMPVLQEEVSVNTNDGEKTSSIPLTTPIALADSTPKFVREKLRITQLPTHHGSNCRGQSQLHQV